MTILIGTCHLDAKGLRFGDGWALPIVTPRDIEINIQVIFLIDRGGPNIAYVHVHVLVNHPHFTLLVAVRLDLRLHFRFGDADGLFGLGLVEGWLHAAGGGPIEDRYIIHVTGIIIRLLHFWLDHRLRDRRSGPATAVA